jgi:hypothetical protein
VSRVEQELLAAVSALQKVRIYVTGHSVTVHSDNKALSFLKRRNVTSSRITRWILQLQEYDMKIVHIKRSDNFFADTPSRNPIGLSQESRDQVLQPKQLFVAKTDLGADKTLMREFGNLSEHHLGDPTLKKLRDELEEDPSKYRDKYTVRDQLLFCKNDRTHPYWRICYPAVRRYVRTLLGHQGTDKCAVQIAHTFHLKSLGRKVRQFVAHCDICQRVKHPDRSYEIERVSHLPTRPGEPLTVDLYGPLPTGRGGVKYLLVCLEFFTKPVTLSPLKTATTGAV